MDQNYNERKKLFRTQIKRASRVSKDIKIPELCRGKTVLDVGCVGQDRLFGDPSWMHERINLAASEVTGVDIIRDKIEAMQKAGYRAVHRDDLSGTDKRFDVVVMADVIEHVNDPVGFLQYYSEYLNPEGILVVTTPNANKIGKVFEILLRNNYSLNMEHTMWLCPKTMLEIAFRAGITFMDFFWMKEVSDRKKVGFFRHLGNRFRDLISVIWTNFNANFMIIFVAGPETS